MKICSRLANLIFKFTHKNLHTKLILNFKFGSQSTAQKTKFISYTVCLMDDPPSQKYPSQYMSFSPLTKRLRNATLKSLAESYFDHTRVNGGKFKRGFVKGLVNQCRASA